MKAFKKLFGLRLETYQQRGAAQIFGDPLHFSQNGLMPEMHPIKIANRDDTALILRPDIMSSSDDSH
jgi:hypothetical protein